MIDFSGFSSIASTVFEGLSAFLFCCVIIFFAVPTIIDRIAFYIPRMILYTHRGEVSAKGIWYNVGEMMLWLTILVGFYTFFFFFQPRLFALVTVSVPAIAAWALGAIYLLNRVMNYRRAARGDYYQVSYRRFMTPATLEAYQDFITSLDRMSDKEIEALLEQDLPYLQQQAVIRKSFELSDG